MGFKSAINEFIFRFLGEQPMYRLTDHCSDPGYRPLSRVDFDNSAELKLILEVEDLDLVIAGNIEMILVIGEVLNYKNTDQKSGRAYIQGFSRSFQF